MIIPRAYFENGQSSVRNENKKELHHHHHHHIHLRTKIPPQEGNFMLRSSDGTDPDKLFPAKTNSL